ncbi:hypothetical protein FNV43_RR06573 [Rhamnella rubrinervis]|uniref:Urea transporter n=1 Tax=Rhamnella rubrinervis TaxID=2594499 RepID=A0A8K0HDT3_9ROSA|nr:hypothetical protein FNV43_RR06573 [Rhamnella rubrinervis]
MIYIKSTSQHFQFNKYYHVAGDGSGSCVRQNSFFEGKAVLNQGVGYSVILGFGAFLLSSHLSWYGWRSDMLVHATLLNGSTLQAEMSKQDSLQVLLCPSGLGRQQSCKAQMLLGSMELVGLSVTAMLLLGGSAVVNALTGVNIYAASFLIPLGVIVYTLAGGLKATFLASYIHSVIVHVVLVIFVYLVYTASSELGSPSVIYNRLLEVASKSRICQEPISHHGQSCGPVSGNYKGSYLTMLSSGGLVFGIINIVGNFGTVFVDNGYWVSAIAARPSSTHKGYLLGGLVWFAVPFSLATSLGLGALALDLPITESEASHGLVPPATAIALMGKGDLFFYLLCFSLTSAGSSELIAVSSLCTYDIYLILNKAGVSLGWMYLAMGVLIGSAVLPIAFMLLWRKANAIGAILGTTTGCVLGIITWLSVTKIEYGRVNLDTTGRNAPMLAGNLVSILTGGAVHAVCSFCGLKTTTGKPLSRSLWLRRKRVIFQQKSSRRTS